MVGGIEPGKQQIGRVSYEKIANFVQNHADIDTANLTQLYSLAQKTDVPIDDYNFEFPVELRRLIDIVSVSHYKLWGTRCKCNENFGFKSKCNVCNHEHDNNLGDQFNTLSYVVTADVPFVIKHRFSDKHYLLKTTTSAPLSTYSSVMWLNSSDFMDYNFYNHITTPCGEQIEGVINWEDQYTTLSETSSGIDEWYKENGIVEQMFIYMLTKGLNLDEA
jgi:hypothetical protein